ncbi:MAG: serine/threonine-protein kinase [Bradymonadaceae bacterium]
MAETTDNAEAGEGAVKVCWQCGETFGADEQVCPDDGETLVELDPSQTQDMLIGRVFDHKYRVLAKLGEGGMSDVYSGRELEGEREVALKVLKADFLRDEQVRKRFMYEARVIAELDHPNAVDLYDFGQAPDGSFYMVMELLEGESLAERLDRAFLDYGEIFAILPPVAEALAEAHDRDVVHRDLKPENIFLAHRDDDETFDPVLLDFGIAKHLRSRTLTREDALWGTPGYMSPEQATGESVTSAADVYSLGVILFEFVTGVLPFRASTPMGYATKHIQKEPRAPSDMPGLQSVPRALDDFVLELLAKDPDDRPDSMGAVAERLRELRDADFDADSLSAVPAGEVDRSELALVGDEAATGRQAGKFEVDADMMVAETEVAVAGTDELGAVQEMAVSDGESTRSHTARIEAPDEPRKEFRPRFQRPVVIGLIGVGLIAAVGGGWLAYTTFRAGGSTASTPADEASERAAAGGEETGDGEPLPARVPQPPPRPAGGAKAAQRAAARALDVRSGATELVRAVERRRTRRRRRRRERPDPDESSGASDEQPPPTPGETSGETGGVGSETRRALEKTF